MTKQFITGADVLRALADGKKVRMRDGGTGYLRLRDGVLVNSLELTARSIGDFTGDWEIVEEPATDAELVAEMRNLAEKAFVEHKGEMSAAYSECADMLKTRKVSP